MELSELARKTSRKKRPISRHPLFPATVALWSGAIFALAGMAVPFGATGRIVVTIALACLGGWIGAILARGIAQTKAGGSQRKRGAATAPAADGDSAAVGAEEFDALPDGPESDASHTGSTGVLHPLAEEYEDEPQTFEEHAPLPGVPTQVLNVTEFGIERLFEAKPGDTESTDSGEEASHDLPSDHSEIPELAQPVTIDAEDLEPPEAEEPVTAAKEPSFDQAQERHFDAPEPSEVEPQTDAPELETPESETNAGAFAKPLSIDMPEGSAAKRIASADLNELSHVELLARLSLSLERHREKQWIAAQAVQRATSETAEPEPEALAAEAFDEQHEPEIPAGEADPATPLAGAEASEEARDSGAGETAPPASSLPAWLRPVGLDDGDDEDTLPSQDLQRHLTMPSDTAPEAGNEPEETDDEPVMPVVVFPGRGSSGHAPDGESDAHSSDPAEAETGRPFDAPGETETKDQATGTNSRDPDETEKALRAALATLQRMSGTG